MKTENRKIKIWGGKLIIWTMGIVGALLISLFITLLLLPYVVNLESVRQKIMATISQQIAGQAVFQKVDFSFFPRPRIVIQQVQVLIPEKASVVAQAITIAPQIIPLLRGEVRILLVKAENPIIALELPGNLPGEKPIPFPSEIIQEQLPLLLKLLESKAPQLTVEVEKGSLNLQVGKQPVFWFQAIQGRIILPPDQLRIDLTCKSNLGENISIGARISSKDLNGDASIQVSDLTPQALLNYLAPAAGIILGDSRGNLKLDLEIDRGKTFRGKIKGASPFLVFQRGEK
ncbi:MAG: rane protein-like, partial [Deltaproteobacteria bacterium]|nr:rane protein-like [Deltaproteobacteria bacterium]